MQLGDGDLHPGKANMRLIRRAIKNGWNVPEEYKAAVVEQMAKVATESDDERNRIAASKVLVAADSVDARFQQASDKPDHPSTVVNVTTAVQVANYVEPTSNARRIEEALALLDSARARALAEPDGAKNDEVHGDSAADVPPETIPIDGLS
jgi:hypothetical protein